MDIMQKSIMWKYIYEEEETLQALLESRQVEEFGKACNLSEINRIIFVASGSSLNIAKTSARLFEKAADVEVKLTTPYQLMDHEESLRGDRARTLVIAVSQTGTSSGTIRAIKAVKEQGFRVLTITERRETPIHKLGDYYLNFLCGLEDCNAKTKGYSNSLVLLWLIALEIGKAKAILSPGDYKEYMDEIRSSIQDIPVTIHNTLEWLDAHRDWSTIRHFLVVGYGMNQGTAEEGMLKLMETLCIPASVSDVGEFSHGIHRVISNDSNVITLLTEEYGYEDMIKINEYLSGVSGRLLVIDASSKGTEDKERIKVGYRPLTASALNIAVVFQVMAVYLPEVIGHDPNVPSNEELTRLLTVRV